MNYKFFHWILAICTASFASQVSSAAVVSNQLPRVTVEELLRAGYWNESLDDNPNGPESRAILGLLEKFKKNSDLRDVAEAMLDDHFAVQPDPLYQVKVAALRGLLQNPRDAEILGYSVARLKKIEAAWVNRYMESTIAVIHQAGIAEFTPLLADFTKQLREGKIEILDLSPQNRQLLGQKLGGSHGLSLNEKKDDHYVVQGAYFEDFQKLAGDFSRPIGETIITLAHEIVHASDIEVKTAKVKFKELGARVKSILTHSLADKVTEDFVGQVLDQVFYDIGKPELVGSLSQRYADAILDRAWPKEAKQPSKEDETVVREWLSSLIASTVVNEYKAYSLSILVYQGLKSFNVILPSGQRDRLSAIIADGDGRFLQQLGVRMSPFMRSLKNYNQLVSKVDAEERVILDHWLHFFEAMYLQELWRVTETWQKQFSGRINKTTRFSEVEMPKDWTRPGGMDSLANPYTLITARVSTLWAIRMKQNVLGTIEHLRELSSSLISLRAGILDLHEINLAELRALQILGPATSEGDSNPSLCGRASSKKSIDAPMSEKYFPSRPWSPSLLLGENAISSSQLLDSLLKLRLLQSFGWLKVEFPDLKNNMIGAKVFVSKLREGLYDQEDLNPTRAKEIEGELLEALEHVNLTSVELGKLTYLHQFLFTAHRIVLDRQWSDLEGSVIGLKSSVVKTLDLMGVEIKSFNSEEFEDDWKSTFAGFDDVVEKIEDVCSQVRPMISITNDSHISLNGVTVPVKYVCQDKKAFLIRTPCDRPWVSSKIEGGRPLIRLLNGARMIEVIPYSQLHR